jgi:transposase
MLSLLLPWLKYLHLDSVTLRDGVVVVVATTKQRAAPCPLCGRRSRRVHSRYQRKVADLPLATRPVVFYLRAHKFFCGTPTCPRRIFTERLPDFVAPHGRRSHGLRHALQEIGRANGGEAGARLARRLGMPTSPDTLLGLIRAVPLANPGLPRVVGVDEWAWRKGLRYGTTVVDLEQHRPLALLPERDADAVAAWLATQPQIEIIARDRSGLFAEAAARGAPQARQVADRFHLLRNLGEALETLLLRKRELLKETAATLAALTPPASLGTPGPAMYRGKRKTPPRQGWQARAEAVSLQRHARWVTAYEAIRLLHGKGVDIADIARTVGVSRPTVYRYLRMDGPPDRKRPVRRTPAARVGWEAYVLGRWQEGCHNGRQLWRDARAQGYPCSERAVSRFVAGLRQGQAPAARTTARGVLTSTQGPTARHVSFLLLRRPAALTTDQILFLTHLCEQDPSVAAAYALAQEFAQMLRTRTGEQHLETWIAAATQSEVEEVQRFAGGLTRDYAAVRAGLTLVHSNAQTEGQITKLKLVRRSMYGRGKIDLLQRRFLPAS